MAKSKVAPIKQLTVPKLELCAALLAARLCQHIKSAIDCKTSRDSLQTPNIIEILDFQRYNSYMKLLRVTAYVNRFVNNCRRSEKIRGPLETHEMDVAARQLIIHVQRQNYPEVKKYLLENKSSRSRRPTIVTQLDLFMDDDKLIRCGGRLHNAPLQESTRFPYLLPSKHQFTDLIIKDAHIVQLHSGTASTVTFLRQKYWIPSIRQRVRKIVRSCVTCRKVTGKAYSIPDAPPLPSNRLKQAPSFTVTGIDFTGALTVKTPHGDLQKAYICLFTCANTRAIHLEIVSDCGIIHFGSTAFLQ
ncbi:uncharacterized protein LOC132748914 [Ruditapes philippinarum]|uniref:uncharacterized protein LOC132748914 n=1 Tax=Ruditapes philippinarum TaxID=129788 RepID=UPI00295A9AEE|nr:uncharacterized protein LOC132748914 [Ruditapes philippinarum]